MSIASQLQDIKQSLPSTTRLVAVSKYHPVEMLEEAYQAGQRIFGESHVQELVQKRDALPSDIAWHFIGHLQTNKVKYIAPFVALIHAVDSEKLLIEIDKQAGKCGRIIPVLLQLHVAQEETKYGFTPEECKQYLIEGRWKTLQHVQIAGVMCMASNVEDEEQVGREFEEAYQFFCYARAHFFADEKGFCECSMGMSDDYPIALQHGSTLVRVGSKIFGQRAY